MTRQEQLVYCKVCTKRQFDPNQGIICSLTGARADFQDRCQSIEVDQQEVKRQTEFARDLRSSGSDGGHYASDEGETGKGVGWGVLMMIVAVVWFFGGLAAGYIFYYPPVLFIMGVIALARGAASGRG